VLLAGLLAAPGIFVRAEDAQKTTSRLAYTMKIDLTGSTVHMTGTVAGHSREQCTRFVSFGLREKVKIGVRTDGGLVAFSYRVPIGQSTFKDPFQPVLNKDHFAGFLSTLVLAPQIEGVSFTDIPLTVEAPEGWKVATSRGVGAARYTLASLRDLTGTLVCAGDYATYSFDLPHKGDDASTKCYVAIRGERDWDDQEFVDEFRRLVHGQMNYFGGSHPAPVQFLALHLLPKGVQPRVPAFNRRAPGQDTILALHVPARPRRHFEFLGMLAHEHLHNWYPNAMKSDLGPWFMEGLNDYVAYRGLLANGLHTREQFSGMLSKWHREYEWCVRTRNRRVMPYRRGMIAAWVLDIEIRRATHGQSGLTDVLMRLIQEKPEGGVVRRPNFLAMLKQVSGQDMEALYRHLVEDDGPIDLAAHLEGTGFRIVAKTRAIRIRPETDAEKKLFKAILSE
jgi:predicted metalloprotease with PDZ domain